MIELFTALGAGVGGLFLAVTFSGLLAGIISYGVVESYLKGEVQRRATVDLIEKPLSLALKTPFGRADFETLFGPKSGKALPYRGGDRPPVLDYMKFLDGLSGDGSLIPTLLGLPGRSAYALHYRQLCGQIASSIQREAMMEAGEPGAVTPVTDVMAFVFVVRKSLPHRVGPGADEKDPLPPYELEIDGRSQGDRALAEVDLLQIRLSERVERLSFGLSLIAVILIFAALAFPAFAYLNLAKGSELFLLRAAGGLGAWLAGLMVLTLLAFSASVIASLTFRWIDRVASPR